MSEELDLTGKKNPSNAELVDGHWGIDGQRMSSIRRAVNALGLDSPNLSLRHALMDASLLDHLHGGGLATTEELLSQMRLPERRGLRGCDIGCGLGGPARWIAMRTGAHIDGVDATKSFVSVAEYINEKTNMQKQCSFQVGDATRLPFGDSQFDFATLMAVSCNIPDRARLYGEIHRVLKPRGAVGMLDILKGEKAGLALPVPWSGDGSEAISRLLSLEETVEAASAARLRYMRGKDMSPLVLAWFVKEQSELQKGRNLGFEVALPKWKDMVDSQVKNLRDDHIRFSCLVFEKPAAQ